MVRPSTSAHAVATERQWAFFSAQLLMPPGPVFLLRRREIAKRYDLIPDLGQVYDKLMEAGAGYKADKRPDGWHMLVPAADEPADTPPPPAEAADAPAAVDTSGSLLKKVLTPGRVVAVGEGAAAPSSSG